MLGGRALPMLVPIFLGAAAVVWIAGYALEASSNQLAGKVGLCGIVFGGTILALATACPEFSTGYSAAKGGDFALAVSAVVGSNTFLPAALLSGRAVLTQAGAELSLTGLGPVLTTIYLWGMLFRPPREYLRLDPDSIAVLIVCLVGIDVLVAVASGSGRPVRGHLWGRPSVVGAVREPPGS